jgi:cation-transporting ATPase 13A3/4/5
VDKWYVTFGCYMLMLMNNALPGWLMLSAFLLTSFSTFVLLGSPHKVKSLLGLMTIPVTGRYTLLVAVVINVGLSMAFEEWGTQRISTAIGSIVEWLQHRHWRRGDKAAYKLVEGGMR